MMEIWKDIAGYEGLYQVSDHGRVRSLDRIIDRGPACGVLKTKGRVLKTALSCGYPSCALSKNGRLWTVRVHRLVMEAFIGPRLEDHDIAHADGDRKNNHLSNLRYATRRENLADAVRHGTVVGANNGNAKLTAKQVVEIRDAYKRFEQELADRFGVSAGTIRNVKTGRTYKGKE